MQLSTWLGHNPASRLLQILHMALYLPQHTHVIAMYELHGMTTSFFKAHNIVAKFAVDQAACLSRSVCDSRVQGWLIRSTWIPLPPAVDPCSFENHQVKGGAYFSLTTRTFHDQHVKGLDAAYEQVRIAQDASAARALNHQRRRKDVANIHNSRPFAAAAVL